MMNIKDFFDKYQSSIEVIIDWNYLISLNCKITTKTIKVLDEIYNIYTPWYALKDSTPCDYRFEDAIPQSLYSVSQNKELCNYHKIKEWQDSATQLSLPGYLVSKHNILLLDGNHRAVASVCSKVEISICLNILNGPISQKICPDLIHWENF